MGGEGRTSLARWWIPGYTLATCSNKPGGDTRSFVVAGGRRDDLVGGGVRRSLKTMEKTRERIDYDRFPLMQERGKGDIEAIGFSRVSAYMTHKESNRPSVSLCLRGSNAEGSPPPCQRTHG